MTVRTNRRALLAGVGAALAMSVLLNGEAPAASASELNAKAQAALARLQQTEPVTAEMVQQAKGILVFPEIIKGGLIIGAAGGDGVLYIDGQTAGYFRSTAVSYGLQAGISKFGFVMFLMDDQAVDYVRSTEGWEVGVGPNVTVADEGFARKFTTTSTHSGIYVFFVNQEGFFAGAGIEGTKISRLAK